MDHLLDFVKRCSSMKRAPKTRRGQYPAPSSPYKPLLLLVVLKRIQQRRGSYASNRILYQDCVRDFSILYVRHYGASEQLDSKVAQPFWYLGVGSPQIWELIPRPGQETEFDQLRASRTQIKSGVRLDRLVQYARFRDCDWNLLVDPDASKAIIGYLMKEHFSSLDRELDQF